MLQKNFIDRNTNSEQHQRALHFAQLHRASQLPIRRTILNQIRQPEHWWVSQGIQENAQALSAEKSQIRRRKNHSKALWNDHWRRNDQKTKRSLQRLAWEKQKLNDQGSFDSQFQLPCHPVKKMLQSSFLDFALTRKSVSQRVWIKFSWCFLKIQWKDHFADETAEKVQKWRKKGSCVFSIRDYAGFA